MSIQSFYKHFILTLFLILPFSFSTTYANVDNNKKKPVEWLFVITSVDAEIKKNDQGQYQLILKHAHIERVLAFSDRPNRIVKMISPEDFKKLWGEGQNSFEKDPPNAIAVFGQEKIAMTLMSVSVDAHKTAFVVTSDDDGMRAVKMADVSVFIDFYCSALGQSLDGLKYKTCPQQAAAEGK